MKQRRLTDYSVFKDTGTEMIQLIQPGSDLQKAYALQPNVCKSKNWKGRIDIKMRWQKSVFDYNWHLFYPGVNICPKKSETVSPQIWVFWNCLSWSTRKSSKLSIKIFLKLSIKRFRNITQYFQAKLKNIINSDCSFNIKETQVCARADSLKWGRTSAHIFCICSVQNCLSQVKISETVYSLSGFWNCLSWKGQANCFLFTPDLVPRSAALCRSTQREEWITLLPGVCNAVRSSPTDRLSRDSSLPLGLDKSLWYLSLPSS